MSLLNDLDNIALEEVKPPEDPKIKQIYKQLLAKNWWKMYDKDGYTNDPGPSFLRQHMGGGDFQKDYINDSIDYAKKIEKYILDKENFK